LALDEDANCVAGSVRGVAARPLGGVRAGGRGPGGAPSVRRQCGLRSSTAGEVRADRVDVDLPARVEVLRTGRRARRARRSGRRSRRRAPRCGTTASPRHFSASVCQRVSSSACRSASVLRARRSARTRPTSAQRPSASRSCPSTASPTSSPRPPSRPWWAVQPASGSVVAGSVVGSAWTGSDMGVTPSVRMVG
jgi:hypothetical protein